MAVVRKSREIEKRIWLWLNSLKDPTVNFTCLSEWAAIG